MCPLHPAQVHERSRLPAAVGRSPDRSRAPRGARWGARRAIGPASSADARSRGVRWCVDVARTGDEAQQRLVRNGPLGYPCEGHQRPVVVEENGQRRGRLERRNRAREIEGTGRAAFGGCLWAPASSPAQRKVCAHRSTSYDDTRRRSARIAFPAFVVRHREGAMRRGGGVVRWVVTGRRLETIKVLNDTSVVHRPTNAGAFLGHLRQHGRRRRDGLR